MKISKIANIQTVTTGITKFFLAIAFVLIGMTNSFANCTSATVDNCEEITIVTDNSTAWGSCVRVVNRTNHAVEVYMDGYYLGYVYSNSNYRFPIRNGCHEVRVLWSTGYYEWFDFCVRGDTQVVRTSDYD